MTVNFDLTLGFAWLAALVTGVIMVASSSSALAIPGISYGVKHVLYVLASICAFGIVIALPLKIWELGHKTCLFAAILLALVVLIPGIGTEVNGSRRWIDFGFFTVQASEWVKFLVLIYIAGFLSRSGDDFKRGGIELVRPILWLMPIFLLILIEPDFGTLVVLVALTTGLFFTVGVRLRHFFAVAIIISVVLAILLAISPYRVERFAAFLDPWASPFGSGYQLTQALIAFGRGELTGIGLGDGVQKLFYLPEAHNDFIFAVIAEELGLLGALFVVALLGFIVLRGFRIGRAAVYADRAFAGYLAYGASLIIGAQVLINVGVNTGVLPTKGLTLPFISYGGNSLLVCSMLMGLIQRTNFEVSARTKRGRSF